MTPNPTPPENEPFPENDPDDELLTAFLDGELSDSEKAETEKRLDAEPHLKARLEKLRAAGRFLDSLEFVPFNREMNATTMEILTSVVQQEIKSAEKRRHRQNWIVYPLLLFLALGLFLLADSVFRARTANETLSDDDYPVFSALDELEAVQDLGFLRQLKEVPEFSDPETSGKTETAESGANGGSGKNGTAERSESSGSGENLSSELFLKKARFFSLSKKEREKYRTLRAEIGQAEDHEELERVLVRFGDWFWDKIYESERYRFWITPEDQRLDYVKQLLKKKVDDSDSFKTAYFTPGFGWHQHQMSTLLKKKLPEEVREEKLAVQDDFREFMEHRPESSEQGDKPGAGRGFRKAVCDFIQEKGIDFFTGQLSDKGKEFITSLSDEQKNCVVRLLVMKSLFYDSPDGQGRYFWGHPALYPGGNGRFWKTEATAELAETLRELPEKTREELLNLPADEMYSQLLILHWGGNLKPISHGKSDK